MEKTNIWLIGLAVMWANLARNIANNGYKISVFNRTYSVTSEFIKNYWNSNFQSFEEIKDFVNSIERPRKIIIMIQSWNPVDVTIETLIPLLDKWDTIIDCWNSFYKDTQRRNEYLKKHDIMFVGCWVSWWEEWALKWPSIMPWWDIKSYNELKDILESISASDFEWWKCVSYIWDNWAGHFVKMVHNGIEYSIMQMIAEWYDSLRKIYWLSALEISKIFKNYNSRKLNSYLFEITYKVLEKKDEFESWALVDYILDKAGAKWTGKWTSIEWYERLRSVSTIWEATYARVISSQKDLRIKLAKIYDSKITWNNLLLLEEYIHKLENTLYLWMIFSYAQWYSLIQQTAREENWSINLSEVSRIWQWWCIIRAEILKFFTQIFKNNKSFDHIFELDEISKEVLKWLQDYKDCMSQNIQCNIALLSLWSGLNYFQAITDKNSSANLIQWLRDYFWAHTYERIDKEWIFHTNW
jgi:6-phosphogluconate dehydrogenase